MYKTHQSLQDKRRIWSEIFGFEFPFICNVPELAARGDTNDLIVERVALVEEMLVDLINNRLCLFRDLHGDPLGDDNSDTTANDVVSRFLLLSFRDQGVGDEGVEIEMVDQSISRKANSRIYRIFEQDILIFRRCNVLAYINSSLCR